jgi:hypothetical protein
MRPVKTKRLKYTYFAVSVLIVVACGRPPLSTPKTPNPTPTEDGTPRIVIDSATKYQTITGWEATAQSGQDDSAAFLNYRDQLFDRAVDELGIDRVRVELRSGAEYSSDTYTAFRNGQISEDQWRAVRYATVNDNGDPFSLNMSGFHFAEFNNQIEKIVLPMRERLEARGRKLFINVNYVGFTHHIGAGGQYHHDNPEEYAEFVQACYRNLIERYAIVPDAWEIALEPDNTPHWTPAYMRRALVATGNRLESMGLTPRFIAPSTTNMRRALDYADAFAEGGLPRFWSELSYHRYSGVSTDTVRMIAARAKQWGVATAMLEHIGAGYETLHEDLKEGQNTAWAQFTLGFPSTVDDGASYYLIDDSNKNAPVVRPGARTLFLAQYFRYIRRQAVRIDAASSDATFDPVAFVNPDATMVVVVKVDKDGTFAVQGLAPGTYEVTTTTSERAGQRLATINLPAGGLLRVTAPARGVVTVSGSVN